MAMTITYREDPERYKKLHVSVIKGTTKMDSRLVFVFVCSFIIVLLRFLLAATFTYKLRILRFRHYMPILLVLISPAVPCTIALALASTNQTEVAIRIGSLTLMCLLLVDIVSRPRLIYKS
jgi:hypothetical protein